MGWFERGLRWFVRWFVGVGWVKKKLVEMND